MIEQLSESVKLIEPLKKKKNGRGRANEVNFLQTFGIILVVLGHSHPLYISFPAFYQKIFTYIYSFHMPLFFFISGYLFIITDSLKKKSYKGFIVKKLGRLLLPYFVLSTILFIPKIFFTSYSNRNIDVSVQGFIRNLVFPYENVLGHFWYLPTLFLVFAIAPITKKLLRRHTGVVLIATLIFSLYYFYNPFSSIKILNISGIGHYLIYFWLGCVVGNYRSIIVGFLRYKYYLVPLLVTLSFIVSPGFFSGIIGISMSYTIGVLFFLNKQTFIKYLDGYSYQIFLLSWPAQALCYILLYLKLNLGFYFTALFMFFIGIIIPIILTKIIVKYVPYFKRLIGM